MECAVYGGSEAVLKLADFALVAVLVRRNFSVGGCIGDSEYAFGGKGAGGAPYQG